MKKQLITAAFTLVLSATAFAANNAETTAALSVTSTHSNSMVTATAKIQWAAQSNDQLILTWTSPQGLNKGDCHDSTMKIKQGTPVLQSSRVLWYQSPTGAPVACTGTWTASVVNTTTDKVLATAQYVNLVK